MTKLRDLIKYILACAIILVAFIYLNQQAATSQPATATTTPPEAKQLHNVLAVTEKPATETASATAAAYTPPRPSPTPPSASAQATPKPSQKQLALTAFLSDSQSVESALKTAKDASTIDLLNANKEFLKARDLLQDNYAFDCANKKEYEEALAHLSKARDYGKQALAKGQPQYWQEYFQGLDSGISQIEERVSVQCKSA